VIKDCEQRESLDYQETYNSVIEHSTLRNIFAIAIARNCKMITFDVKTAFLYGELEDVIFMYPPEGYNYKNKILKFKKAIYGLRQAPLKWNMKFTNFLKKMGFKSLSSEQCVFKKNDNNLILGIYVDNDLLIENNSDEMDKTLKKLGEKF